MLSTTRTLSIDLSRTSEHLEDLYLAFDEASEQTDAARWAACVRRLAVVERTWIDRGWITKGDFALALVVLNHEEGKSTTPTATVASLLLAVTTSIESRQQKSVWATALQEVLDGHLSAERAAEMGVTAAKNSAARRKKAEAQRTKSLRSMQRPKSALYKGIQVKKRGAPAMK